ncbi:hypothetical protein DENSPDRAFT_144345 [Dentipellis sp. KUC8613]|nr:hypothetical protein DENSPDRAFT_144345 [Dentipellis sp. KUC8613]
MQHVLTVFNPLIKDSGRLTLRGSQTARSSPVPSSSRMVTSQATSLRSASLPPQPPSGVKQWAERSLAAAVVPADCPPAQNDSAGAGALRSAPTSLGTTFYPSASSSKTHPMSPYTPDSAASMKARMIEPSIRPSDRLAIANLLGTPRTVVSPIPTRPARSPSSVIPESWAMPIVECGADTVASGGRARGRPCRARIADAP